MLQKTALGIWLLALATGAGWLLWRHGELRKVRQENSRLREQITGEKLSVVSALPVGQTAASPASPPLTPEERAELLTLRGKAARLYRDLPAASNRLAGGTRPSSAASESAADAAQGNAVESDLPEETRQFLRAGSKIGERLRSHIEAHDGRLPESLDHWEGAAGLDAEAMEVLERLELMPNAPLPPEARADTLVAREREPRQAPDGKWIRGYIRGDGHAVSLGPVEESDFPRLERRLTGSAKERARRDAARKQPPSVTPSPSPGSPP
ncbi:MAG: hypothetical protein KIT22_17115 [Verrucomicrobiae bacterium]|nr:hypothetical protein [Verrucomicrobiae bacterium]